MDSSDKQEPIAIIGAACRFAGEATSLDSLWDMLSKVKTGHCPVPGDRWDSEAWYHPDPDRKGGFPEQHGYFLQQDFSHVDAPFFSITAKEAAAMDPAKRLLLEVSYESIENAGIHVEDLMNSNTGCYVGCMNNDYEMISLHDVYDIGQAAAMGVSEAMTANRVSWFFGLKGPSMTLDTACSSSLYALHLACQSLRLKETNMSLVAGVNLIISPNMQHQTSALHMLSPDGVCHTFDDRATGYGRGEGIGALMVKRLSDAIRDGDTIRAVIRHTGVNGDGKTPSITQPSSEAQADLIRQVYKDAGLDPADTGYFECHGTGTLVGDPLEVSAVASTVGAARQAAGKSPLYIGSIKPTVGHTEGCAGLAGIFKSLCMLEKGMLVPTYGVERVNPKLTLDEWHLALPKGASRWSAPGPRRISVNSFGFGGANAHLILDDAYHYLKDRGLSGKHNTTVYEDADSDSGLEDTSDNGSVADAVKQLFLFSSKDQAGTQRAAEKLAEWLQRDSKQQDGGAELLDNLAYTLGLHRSNLEYKTYAVAGSVAELTEKLSSGLSSSTRTQGNGENVIMVFTGQGAQWPAMGRELYEHPVFRQSLDLSQVHLESLGCKWNVLKELTKSPNRSINLPEYSQPLCTLVQVALVDLLRFWKVSPTAIIGHSSGEIAAAYAASKLSHYDAIKLAYFRGRASASASKKGAMMAAGVSQEAVQAYLEKVPQGSVVVACINSPSSVTLSGDADAINKLERMMSVDGKFARRFRGTTAYHSPHMKDAAASYLEMIGEITPRETEDTENSPFLYSSLTGSIVTSAKELDAQYWVNHMLKPVQFSQAFLALLNHKKVAGDGRLAAVKWGVVVEVGPHAALQGPVKQIIDSSDNKFAKAAPYASMLLRGIDAAETSLGAAGTLWAAGAKVDMGAVNQHSTLSRTAPHMLCDLPTYPWNHSKSYWHESYLSRSHRFPSHKRTDFLGVPEDSQRSHEPRWRNFLRVSENPWIEDHTITGTVLYPGAGMLVMAVEGVLRTADSSRAIEGFRITDVNFDRGLVISLEDDAPVETSISFHQNTQQDTWAFTVSSMTKSSPWVKHCTGNIALEYVKEASQVEDGSADVQWQRDVESYKALTSASDSVAVDVDVLYKDLETIGMQYGTTFRNVTSVTSIASNNVSHGTVAVPDTAATMPMNYESPHVIHPATLDSIFHLILAALGAAQPLKQAAVPYAIDEMYIAHEQPKNKALYSGYGRLVSQNGREINTELVVSDQEWTKPKITVKNFALRQVTAGDDSDAANSASAEALKNCAEIAWIPDLSLVKSNETLAKLATSGTAAELIDSYLDSVFMKTSNGTALVAMFDDSESSRDVLRRLKARTYGPKRVIAVATSHSAVQSMRDTLGEDTADMSISYKSMPGIAIFSSLTAQGNDVVIGLGVPEVAKHAETLANLAPVACLSYATPATAEIKVADRQFVSHLAEDGIHVLLSSTPVLPSAELVPESAVLLLPASPSDALNTFAATIQSKLESTGVSVSRANLTLRGVDSLGGKHVISLLEIDSPLVYSWNENQFEAFKILLSTVGHLFWVTHGSVIESWSNGIEFAATQGLFRVMRNEYPVAVLPTLDLSTHADISTAEFTELVLSVWQSSLANGAEMEYAESNGLIYVPRAVEVADLDYELQLANKTAKPVLSILGSEPLKATESAVADSYVWIPDEQVESPVEDGKVEVKVEYAGLSVGAVRHAVGTVTRTSSVAFEAGQRVIVYSDTAARTHVRQTESLVVPLPEGLGAQEAAALVDPLITAQYVLVETAHIERDQSILLDNAASAVGQALIQVAQSIGANVFALVHDRQERELLAERFGIPSGHIFDSALGNFVPLILTATQNCGVDVVVSQQSGKHVAGALSILSDFGYSIDISGESSRVLPVSKANSILARIDMAAVIRSRPHIVSKLFQSAFTSHKLQGPSSLTVLPATDLSASLKSEQAVVSLSHGTPVLVPAPPSEPLKLDSEATYVLAGGLGAVGLDVANWMVGSGARNLVFLSRSGGAKNQEDLDRFAAQSVKAEAIKCNVNNTASVAKVFNDIRASGRRVGGVIQLAVVLADGIFENMSFSQWGHAIEPKTKGSRNLLENLVPSEKPFFILLSSITGVIGNTAQANYSAGNTFEDALANYAHTHLGINATSIDVGLVADSAHFTAAGGFGDLASYLGRYKHGWRGLRTNLGELGVAMRAIMRESGKRPLPQLVLGMGDRLEYNKSVGGFSIDKKFELRVVKSEAAAADGTAKRDITELLTNAKTMPEAEAAVEEDIKTLVAVTMGISADEVDGQKPLYDYGVDSLQAVEIRNRALVKMKSDISVFNIMSTMPLAEVSAQIAAKSELVKIQASED